ncbi:MAG: hypothetical protein JJLCMIEE_00257 [Acidimicrobiales bacterium]|nr:MAG: ferredoxin [Actinomycetota bacterium]MBV6507216.1 hypothetical protein [Acidimicrobiales bacterium]RIK05498.1 MAG: ferredoxin [Acidobacteriota bacterium]
MKVSVDDAVCVGHGRCYAVAPEVFGADDNGHCVVHRAVVDGVLADKARLAARNCPEEAITAAD